MARIFTAVSLVAVALVAATLAAPTPHHEPPAQAKPLFQGAKIDGPTLALFRRACQNCHSENTHWPWYSRIPPVSWVIGKDVVNARRHVNFSNWDAYRPEEQGELLARIGSAVRSGRMPLRRYTLLHREAVLASRERLQIYEWTKTERKRLRAAGIRTSWMAMGPPAMRGSPHEPLEISAADARFRKRIRKDEPC